jgi:hypothetical protein
MKGGNNMTIKTLVLYLQDFPEDAEVVMQASNSMYIDSVCDVTQKELMPFYGEGHDVVVIEAGAQIGAV